LLLKVEKAFKNFKREIIVNNSEQLTVKLNGINLTFVKYPFPLVFKLKEYRDVKMLSVEEIAATKAYVLGRRATMKDYIDLYFILKEGFLDLGELIRICRKKYGDNFEPRLFLEQLVFIEDVKKIPVLFLGKRIGLVEILVLFEKEIKKIKL
jgi:predicted nucleotidyltransferase component of viral defense system